MRGQLIRKVWPHDPTSYAPPRYRRACDYEAFIPDPVSNLDLSLPAEVAAVVSDAERALSDVDRMGSDSLHALGRLLLRTESIASSRIEGLAVDARQLARAAVDQTGQRTSSTAKEVLGNIEAMELAIKEAATAERFTIDHLCGIHHRLMEQSPTPRIAGMVRTTQNWIGGNEYNPCGAAFVPPPPEYVPDLLEDLCEIVNQDKWPPMVQAAILHAQFETIHPFADGNGRTGRALIHVVLHRRGITTNYVPPISVEFAKHRDSYIGGLIKYRGDKLDIWIEQFAVAAVRTAVVARHYQESVEALLEAWSEGLRNRHRVDSAVYAILSVLPSHPVITSSLAVAATGRSVPRVNLALEALQEAGILEQTTTGSRNRIWEATELLNLITELEQSE